MCVYDSEAFAERVNFAANYIRNQRYTTRRFDTCFEMYDGDAVVVALVRRSNSNPASKLAANLFQYIREDRALELAQRFAHVETRDLKHEAAKMRQKAKAEFDEWLKARNANAA